MNRQSKEPLWRQRAHEALLGHEADSTPVALTVSGLALAAGVSRQTIWRDKDLMQRIASIQERVSVPKHSAGSKGALERRVKRNELELQALRRENEILLFNILAVAKRLREAGLDPNEFIKIDDQDPGALGRTFIA